MSAAVAIVIVATLAGCGSQHPSSTPSAATPAATPIGAMSPSPTMRYTVGDHFDEVCAIAWPTPPVVTKANLQLTLDCPRVPSDAYPFVIAVYDDPHLKVTTDDTHVHVVGTASDTAASDGGLSSLVVTADSLALER